MVESALSKTKERNSISLNIFIANHIIGGIIAQEIVKHRTRQAFIIVSCFCNNVQVSNNNDGLT